MGNMRRTACGIFIPLALTTAACSRSPQHYLDLGNRLAAQGRFTEAELNYRKAVSKNPQFGDAYYQLARISQQQQKQVQAWQWLSAGARAMPNRTDIAVQLADLSLGLFLADKNRPRVLYDKVVTISDQLLAKDPKSFDGLRLKGHLAAANRQFAQAEDFYRRADSVKPFDRQVILGWTEVLLQDDKSAEAEALASRLIEHDKGFGPIYELLYRYYLTANRPDEAEKILKTQVANNPADAGAMIQLAAFYGNSAREADLQALVQRIESQPGTFPQAHAQLGDLFRQLKRWNDSLAQYQAGIGAAPAGQSGTKQKIVYWKRIADLWLVQNKAQEAFQAAGRILQLDPRDTAARQVSASLLLSTRNPDNVAKAVELLQGLVKQEPGNPLWHYDLGLAVAAQGKSDAARAEYEKAAQERRDYLEPRIRLIEIAQAKGDYRAALDYANQAIAINPNLSSIRLVRAVAMIHTGRIGEGRAELARLDQQFPGNREVQLQLAMQDLRDQKLPEAEEHFRKLAAASPADIRPLKGLADTLAAEKEAGTALAMLQEDLRKSPNDLRLKSLVASTAILAGKLDLGIELYRQLLAAAPNSTTVPLALSRACRAKGDYTNALQYAQKASLAAPGDVNALVNLGELLSLRGRQADALVSYRRALRLQPDNAAALNGAAYAITQTGGNVDEALSMAQKAAGLKPDDPGYTDTLGVVYLKKNYTASAVQLFSALTRKYPDNPAYHYHFGLVRINEGNRAAAKSELQAALSHHPPEDLRQKIEESLVRAGG